MGLSFTIAAGPCQRSHFRLRVPWDWWPYLTISDSRLPFSTRRAVSQSQGQSHIATDGQSISKSWCRAPSWAHDQIFVTFWELRSCFLWGALSDERTGLSFVCVAVLRQRSLSRVRVPWDSWPYFTVSDLRLPFSSPPTTRRVTVEVFDPASTRGVDFSCF
jgi:hypothetical protein